jgi:molybdate transport system ATP-binding protein
LSDRSPDRSPDRQPDKQPDKQPDRPPGKPPLLTVTIQHLLGAVSLDLSFALTEPWTVLFGPSGSGKTTVLRAIAGFIKPDTALIADSKTTFVDRASNLFLPAHLRPVRTAAQTARLFPQMTVRGNAMYGNGWTSRPADAMQIVGETLGLFHLDDLADRMPHELSGGERQRASVARAVVSAITFAGPGKALLLLDEPFSGLDYALRDDLLASLREWLRLLNTPVLSVTHDVGEAFQLSAEVIRIANGRVVQQGPVGQVLSEERQRLMTQLTVLPDGPPARRAVTS